LGNLPYGSGPALPVSRGSLPAARLAATGAPQAAGDSG